MFFFFRQFVPLSLAYREISENELPNICTDEPQEYVMCRSLPRDKNDIEYPNVSMHIRISAWISEYQHKYQNIILYIRMWISEYQSEYPNVRLYVNVNIRMSMSVQDYHAVENREVADYKHDKSQFIG